MRSIEWEFQNADPLLVGTLECASEPALLESGKPGGYKVSEHIPWRFDWKFQVRCSVTEPKKDYKLPLPPPGRQEFIFDPSYCGGLNVNRKRLTLNFRIPDCLDPPRKSFLWQGPIYLADRAFHCLAKLVMLSPQGSNVLRRRQCDEDRSGGIEFLVFNGNQDVVIGEIQDSEYRGVVDCGIAQTLAMLRKRRNPP